MTLAVSGDPVVVLQSLTLSHFLKRCQRNKFKKRIMKVRTKLEKDDHQAHEESLAHLGTTVVVLLAKDGICIG